jgi:hypothetical protein
VSSGVAQLDSAYPALQAYRAAISVVLVIAIMIVNLRGVKESGRVFAVSHVFLRRHDGADRGHRSGAPGPGDARARGGPAGSELAGATRALSVFPDPARVLQRHAALTGVEAISNGITAFKEPRSRNAAITLVWMSLILGTLFLGSACWPAPSAPSPPSGRP